MTLKELLKSMDLEGYPKFLRSGASWDEIGKSAQASLLTAQYGISIAAGKSEHAAAVDACSELGKSLMGKDE